jgi:F0F1-type ATP synthase membrane subunit b/b'
LRSQAAADIERERTILVNEGKTAAEHIAQHARETIRQEVTKARAELHREAALLAVQVATVSVKAQITAADQQRIIDEYAVSLENAR